MSADGVVLSRGHVGVSRGGCEREAVVLSSGDGEAVVMWSEDMRLWCCPVAMWSDDMEAVVP